MSIVTPTALSLARAGAIALATVALLLCAGPGVQSWSRKARAFVFWMAMLALLTPGFASAVVHFPQAMKLDAPHREIYYCWCVWLRVSPVALLAVWLMPPAVSAEAMWCRRLAGASSWWRRKTWELRAWGRGLWLGVALVFLLAFQEFELATTWNLRSWPVALFDAQAGGLALGESMRLAALPLAIQIVLLAAGARFLGAVPLGGGPRQTVSARSLVALVPPLLGVTIHFYVPCFAIAGGILSGAAGHLVRDADGLGSMPWREIGNGLGIACAAAGFAWLLAGWVERRRGWTFLLAVPGMLGPMLAALILLAALQSPLLGGLLDTPFPAVAGLALVLMPFALLLRFGIETTRDGAAVHIARASGGRRARWQLDGWPRLCGLLLLACFAYGDFTVNSLLAPPQFTSASVRLLNLLHYGRSSALMIMFAVAFAVPLTAALLTLLATRFYPFRRAH